LRAECQTLLARSEANQIEAFAVQFERLALHYPEVRLTEGEAKVLKTDWWRLLQGVPADLFALGVDRCVLSTQRFMPTPGQFLARIETDLKHRMTLRARAVEVMQGLNGDAEK
jgi:hypothetical protein